MCKSYLNLAKEFQGLSYDPMIEHTSVVMTRYLMLAALNMNNSDARTIGKLFYISCAELEDIQFSEVILVLLNILMDTLEEVLFLSKEQIDTFIEVFISKLPNNLREKLNEKKVA